MGYLSDVAVAFICEDEKEHSLLKLYLDEHLPEWTKECNLSGSPLEVKPYGFKLEFECIKWYQNYPEIQEFESFLDAFNKMFTLERDELGVQPDTTRRRMIGYQFIRVGEEDTDIVNTEGGDVYDCPLTITRAIEDY